MISPQVIKEQIAPNLEGRQAKCQCGALKPSSTSLGMFLFRGEGSGAAETTCAQCGYYEEAHKRTGDIRHNRNTCLKFRPHGPYEFDSYWCGCGGTD